MKKGIFTAIITSLVLMLSGCGGNMYPDAESNGTTIDQNGTNNGNDGNNTNQILPITVVPTQYKDFVLKENSKSFEIDIKVFNNNAPYTKGVVKVKLPSKAINGVDVGSFEKYEVAVDDQGVAKFNYTGPGNLKALIDSGDNASTFGFYHEDNPNAISQMVLKYEMPQEEIVNRNYSISITTNGEFSIGIPEKKKTFSVALQAKDASNNPVNLDTEKINGITVKTKNSTIAQLLDGTSLADAVTLSNDSTSFTLVSKKLSGLVPVEVTIDFVDINGNNKTLTKLVNVRVMSGPPTAISISYVGTSQDASRSKYIETLAISVTDEYGNKVNTNPHISVGAIAGYAVDGSATNSTETNETKRLFYGKTDIENGTANGEIVPSGGNKAIFNAQPSGVFKYVDAEGNNTDKLVVFGKGKNYEAMGKWDFSKENDSTLNLTDDYYGIQRDKLYYAVGHNYYQDQCREDGREWIGNTDSDGYTVKENGTVRVMYSYDYHLTGKDVLIWVNLKGEQPDTGKKTRIGEVTKHTLRGMGLVARPSDGYTIRKGTSGFGTFTIRHKNAKEWYRNAHFGYSVKSGSTCSAVEVASSNSFDARTCSNTQSYSLDDDNNASTPNISGSSGYTNGTSYVTFLLSAPADKDCTFNITNILPSGEF